MSLRESARTRQKLAATRASARGTLAGMDDLTQIQRLTGELVALLVREFGPEHAARMLEHAAAEIRAAARELAPLTLEG